jgi:pyruvate formate lyase activating enzyme
MQRSAGAAVAAGVCPVLLGGALGLPAVDAAEGRLSWREAKHYKKLDYQRVQCQICPRECRVDDVERGYCATRENKDGKYYTLVYGKPCALNVDPIEKKPLFHFLPGTMAFSLSTAGCCMECKFCQNWDISQVRPEQVQSIDLPPAQVVAQARQQGAKSIAFTYGEPVVFYEYVYDTAAIARQQGVHPVAITSAYILEKPLRELCQRVSAVKVDLKSFSEDYYRNTCSAHLKPVLDALIVLKSEKVWLEIVYLVVPTLNDGVDEIKRMAAWVKKNLGPDVPVHFTRFHPMYKLKNLPPTPVPTLERCRRTALEQGLHYVYVGNVPGNPGENTYCAHCGKALILRRGYYIAENRITAGKCKFCQQEVPGVWA